MMPYHEQIIENRIGVTPLLGECTTYVCANSSYESNYGEIII